VLDRLQGLENEYALYFDPADPAVDRPDHHDVFLALKASLSMLVDTAPGERNGRDPFFVSNGGSFCYEALASAHDGGLIEGATPECRGPSQVLLYQRAQEELLLRALPRTQRAIGAAGHFGELGFLRNCRDAEGHIYGAQENYEAVIAEGLSLFALRLCLVIGCVASVLVTVGLWGLVLTLLVPAVVLLTMTVVGVALLEARSVEAGTRMERRLMRVWRRVGAGLEWFEIIVTAPLLVPWLAALRLFAFRRPRRVLTAFLVTRPVVVGTGTLDGDLFGLSEKGPAVRRVVRWTALPGERPIFDFGNLCKPLMLPFLGRFGAPLCLFAVRQRLQLGLSSGNRADVAEFLKAGTMSLLLDLCEAGALEDAPRIRGAVRTLHSVCEDVELQRAHATSHGPMTALEVQRWYLRRAESWVAEQGVDGPEVRLLLTLWAEAIDGLEDDPAGLQGVLDWPTKKALIDAARPRGVTGAALKKIDLRYHELGAAGYFTQLRDAGLTRRLVDDAAIDAAVETAPSGSPAWQRSELMREHREHADLRVAWGSIRKGRGLRAEVIPLDRFRG
jgi:Pup amidohydrolase